ncbi:MAG: HD domain-containing protein [Alphaproteobacteria bacterium]|nr:HD domain-containing protein [Alphaproteobacteria bacterium]
MSAVDAIIQIMARGGARDYGGERISQLAHGLQCAQLAERQGATPSLIVAALLHDIGHLLNADEWAAFQRGEDARHEERGADFLARHFGPEVSEPVRLHVAAKRYLTAVEPGYHDGLSPVSGRTLQLQGGPFSPAEAAAFAGAAHAQAAIAVRRWDEQGKDPAAPTPDLRHFAPYLLTALARPV